MSGGVCNYVLCVLVRVLLAVGVCTVCVLVNMSFLAVFFGESPSGS